MKKLFLLSTFFLCILVTKNAYSQDANNGQKTPSQQNLTNRGAVNESYYEERFAEQSNRLHPAQDAANANGAACCPADHPCEDQSTGECWCMYVHYEPCYYTTQRCIEEKVPCKKQCCRYVPEYYEVDRCRYVPQYYKETMCRYKPEYYCVDDCKTCYKWVCDQHCKYVPKYYWKHVCGQPDCNAACPAK